MATVRSSYLGNAAGCAAAALLAACGGSQPPIGAPDAMPQSRAIAERAGYTGSWMLPEAKGEDLLYVANYFAAVNVYNYKNLKLVGTLSGLNAPGGECVDERGDVFITDVRGASVVEYAHGGTSPIATLSDSGYYPNDCFVDPASGDLCVANLDGGPVSGNLAVYKKARGVPKFYYDENRYIAYYYSCAYDADGNAFVDASFDSGGLVFDELTVGAKTLTRIRYARHKHGGALDWDGKYMTEGDGGNRVYRFSVGADRKRVYRDGFTTLKNDVGGISKTWILEYGGQREIVGSAQNNDAFQIWTYAAGRSLHIVDTGLDEPDGVAVSLARK